MTPAEVIDQIGARLARATPPRSRVLLFGSHARGAGTDDSDFDVLVIEPTVESPISEAVRLRRELRGLGVPIDVIVMDEAKATRRAAVPGTMVRKARGDLSVARLIAAGRAAAIAGRGSSPRRTSCTPGAGERRARWRSHSARSGSRPEARTASSRCARASS